VAVCENHAPLGNLRQKSFWDIWNSSEAQALRGSIEKKECYCTNEVFLWPSFTYQPARLVQVMVGAKVWRKTDPLPLEDQIPASLLTLDKPGPRKLVAIDESRKEA
jgi:hypothetical protein